MDTEKKPVPQPCIDAATRYCQGRTGYKGHTVRMCDVCGHMEWVSSSNDYEGVQVIWKSEDIYSNHVYCQQCNDASRRSPEVVQWVLGVVTMLELRLTGKIA